MIEFALILIIGGPIIGAIMMLIGLIQCFSKDDKTKQEGSKLLLIGLCVVIVPLLIGFSICSGK